MQKKDEEMLIIQHFRKHFPDFPKGRLISSESPDFMLKISPHRSIGIELTRIGDGRDPVAAVLEAIRRKEEKLPLYTHMNLSEQWLIIHADDALGGTNHDHWNRLNGLEAHSSFDRVFFMDLFSNRVISIIY